MSHVSVGSCPLLMCPLPPTSSNRYRRVDEVGGSGVSPLPGFLAWKVRVLRSVHRLWMTQKHLLHVVVQPFSPHRGYGHFLVLGEVHSLKAVTFQRPVVTEVSLSLRTMTTTAGPQSKQKRRVLRSMCCPFLLGVRLVSRSHRPVPEVATAEGVVEEGNVFSVRVGCAIKSLQWNILSKCESLYTVITPNFPKEKRTTKELFTFVCLYVPQIDGKKRGLQ